MSEKVHAIYLFSGKRKSGKDYVTELLQAKFGKERCSILRLSAPLKLQYAKDHKLNYNRLLDATDYKEKHREDMIKWGEEKRRSDPGYFCQMVTDNVVSKFPVWIISDARRKTDILYFKQNFGDKVMNVRVVAEEEVRKHRGWVFTPGVDDVESECDLDNDVQFDHVLENNGDDEKLHEQLEQLCDYNSILK